MFGQPERIDIFQLVRLLRVRDSSRPTVARRLKKLLMWRLMSGEADTRSFAGFARRLRFKADLSPAFPGAEVTTCRRIDDDEVLKVLALHGGVSGVLHAAEHGAGGIVADLAADLATRRTPHGEKHAGKSAGKDAGKDTDANVGVVEIRTPNYSVASELGPLPEPFLEWVRDRLRDDDQTFAAFLDVFNHRINVLRHQLKATQDVALDYALPQDTLQADFLASLAGVASLDAEAQIVLPRRAWLGMTATLADPRRSSAAALTALRQYLGIPATQLEPLIGDWRPLSATQWSTLGKQATLGGDAVLGTQVWDEMAGVRLSVPNVDYERLCELLPPPSTPDDPDASSGLRQQQAQDDADQHAQQHAQAAGPSHAHRPHKSAAEAAADPDTPLNGYVGLSHMVRLLFDRRVDCTVELTTPAAYLPESLLAAEPGTGVTAPVIPGLAAALPAGVRYRGLRLGQSAWLASRSGDVEGLRTVRFMIEGDPEGPLQ